MASNNPFYVDPGNDFSTGLSGLSGTLSSIRKSRIDQAEEQRKLDADRLKQERLQLATTEGMAALKSGDPQKAAEVAIKYPEFSENLRNSFGFNDEAKAAEAGSFAKTLLTAAPEQRESIYQERIQNLRDKGRDPTHTIQSLKNYQQNPNGELQALETTWAGAFPKEYLVISNQHKAEQEQALANQKMQREDARFERAESGRNQRAYARAAATAGGSARDKQTAHQKDFEQYQSLLKTDPESAKSFGQASGFVSKEGRELAPGVQTRLAKTIDSAVAAENSIGKYNTLATDIEKSDLRGGVLGGSWSEKVKEITGSQDSVTELRKEFAQARASQASANLPPGSASDADVALALGPIPSDNANKQQLASYLRGQAKLAQINADFHNFKADYISNTGSERGMLQAWKEQGKAGATQSRRPAIAPQPAAAPAAGGWRIVE